MQVEDSPICVVVLKTLVVHFKSQDSCVMVESKIIIGTFDSFDFSRGEFWETMKLNIDFEFMYALVCSPRSGKCNMQCF